VWSFTPLLLDEAIYILMSSLSIISTDRIILRPHIAAIYGIPPNYCIEGTATASGIAIGKVAGKKFPTYRNLGHRRRVEPVDARDPQQTPNTAMIHQCGDMCCVEVHGEGIRGNTANPAFAED